MYALMIYSLKVGACLAVFYLFFKLLLSRETFHRLNRIVVLGAMIASFVLPLCVITLYREVPAPPEMPLDLLGVLAASEPAEATPTSASFPWEEIVVGVFAVGVAAMLGWVLHSLLGVVRVIRSGRREELPNGQRLVILPESVTPFSWGRYVVLSEEDLEQNGEAILRHEQAHLRLHHSVDLLITDLAGCLQWFNPAMWLLRRELRAIHEFEADEAVLRSGVDARHYQMLLIKKAAGRRWYSVANSLNHSKLKTRITMMLRKRSSRWAAARTLLLLPLAGVALGAFAETRYVVVPDDKGTKNPSKTSAARVENPSAEPVILRIRGAAGDDPAKQPLILVDGKRSSTLDTLRTEQIASISVLKDSTALSLYGDEGKNGVILVTLIKGSAAVDSVGYITIEGQPVTAAYSDSRLEGNPVIIVDGERYEGNLNDLDVQRIKSMSVYKSNIPEEYRTLVGPDNEGMIEIKTRPLGETKSGYVSLPEGSLEEAQRKMAAYFGSDEWKAAQQRLAESHAYFESDEWKQAQEMLKQLGKTKSGDVSLPEGSLEEAQRKMAAYFESDEWKEAQKRLEMLGEMGLEGSGNDVRMLDTKYGEVSDCNTVLGATGGALVTGPDVMSKTRSTDEGTVTVVKGRVTADFSAISEANYRIELDGKPATKADLEALEPGVIKLLELESLSSQSGEKGLLRVRTRR